MNTNGSWSAESECWKVFYCPAGCHFVNNVTRSHPIGACTPYSYSRLTHGIICTSQLQRYWKSGRVYIFIVKTLGTKLDALNVPEKVTKYTKNGLLWGCNLIIASTEKKYYGLRLRIDFLIIGAKIQLNELFGGERPARDAKREETGDRGFEFFSFESDWRQIYRVGGRSSTDKSVCALLDVNDQYDEGYEEGELDLAQAYWAVTSSNKVWGTVGKDF